MTDKELDQLFKNAVDHPVEGADPAAAWAEANAMIRAGQGFGLTSEAKLQWSFGGLLLLGVMGMTILNSESTVDYQPTTLTYHQAAAVSSDKLLVTTKEEVPSSVNVLAEETRIGADLAVLNPETKPKTQQTLASYDLEEGDVIATNFELVKEAGQIETQDHYANITNDIIPTSGMVSMTSLDFDSYNLTQKLAEATQLPKADFVKPLKAGSYLALTAGATLSRGVVQDGSQATNMGTFQRFGLKYFQGISQHLSAGIGLEYYSMSGRGLELAYDSLNYSFGYSKTRQTIRPNSLHYLSIPLELQVQLTPKHQIAVGADVSYLMNVRSQMEESELNDFGEVVVSNENSWGYLSGLKDWNANASVSYAYKMSVQLDVQAMMNYGLINIHEDAASNHMNRIRYSLGVVYKLKQFE